MIYLFFAFVLSFDYYYMAASDESSSGAEDYFVIPDAKSPKKTTYDVKSTFLSN